MNQSNELIDRLSASPVVPVFFHPDQEYTRQIVQACYTGGLRFFEYTNRGQEAFDVFQTLAPWVRAHCPEMALGIGTIYTPESAAQFLEAGADFVVQPVTTKAVGDICRQAGKPWIPGAFTTNEIWSAWTLGAAAVKVFPGNLLGPDYIRAIKGPMPNVPLMVTGGIDPSAEHIRPWLQAGVTAVGIGSQLFSREKSLDAAQISEHIKTLTDALRR